MTTKTKLQAVPAPTTTQTYTYTLTARQLEDIDKKINRVWCFLGHLKSHMEEDYENLCLANTIATFEDMTGDVVDILRETTAEKVSQ